MVEAAFHSSKSIGTGDDDRVQVRNLHSIGTLGNVVPVPVLVTDLVTVTVQEVVLEVDGVKVRWKMLEVAKEEDS
ncbi:hypothetical protein DPX16_1879 [Anabarilius grahami]|uniref:Uncharacterized protein n=1 Tax=Anabarilius grahami TaxID=495550 RepID=A0A3N0YRU6_ANAGA|nr:hypothetical protein DPX16_1879 [Anabarilius grahami]